MNVIVADSKKKPRLNQDCGKGSPTVHHSTDPGGSITRCLKKGELQAGCLVKASMLAVYLQL